MYFVFQYLDSFLIRTYKINGFLFRQHCDYMYLIVLVLNLSIKSYLCPSFFARNCKKCFSKGYKNEIRGKQIIKMQLIANTEGISMTNISVHPLKGPT